MSLRAGNFPKPIHQVLQITHKNTSTGFSAFLSPQKEVRLLEFLLLMVHIREKPSVVNSTCIFSSRNIVTLPKSNVLGYSVLVHFILDQ